MPRHSLWTMPLSKLQLIMLLLLPVLLPVVRGYSSGAPTAQCNMMYPGHGVPAQMGPSPYVITASQPTFGCPNDNITGERRPTWMRQWTCRQPAHNGVLTDIVCRAIFCNHLLIQPIQNYIKFNIIKSVKLIRQ